jgi:hypothetical protein
VAVTRSTSRGAPVTVIRIGNPWLAIPITVVFTSVMVALGGLYLSVILSGEPKDPALRAALLMVSVPLVAMVALMLILLALILVRQPRTLTGSLVLTPDEIIMPSPRHRRVPIYKVAGVGLVLQQSVPGRGGMWMLTVWTVDDTQVMVGAFLRKSEILQPENTRIARAAEQVYRHVVERQGADGPLVTIARQRTIQFSRFSPFRQVLDPSDHLKA